MEIKRVGSRFERQLLWLVLVAGAGGAGLSVYLLWSGDYSARVRWTAVVFLTATWWLALALRDRAVRPIQTLANMVGSMREGDFSMRVRGARSDDALGELIVEANALSESLREERLAAVEATRLLRNVMAAVDVAILAFDEEHRLRLVNRAAEELLGDIQARLIGRSASELDLDDCIDGEPVRTIERRFPGGDGRWGVRRSSYRDEGRPSHLLVVSNLSQALREEERSAWQRLIRVLAHELNNSLAPIKSIAGSLRDRLAGDRVTAEEVEDLRSGLSIIAGRSESLSRFLVAYTRLAKLPPPVVEPVEIAPLVRAIAALETRLEVEVVAGPSLEVPADRDQIQQLLVNLVQNAVDASLETDGGVRCGWERANGELVVWVEDDGPGLVSQANLFVPFFTTKPEGTGIGLALCRQIAERHRGRISLDERADGRGCIARLRLPLVESLDLDGD